MWNEDWATQALCNETRPDELFVRGAAQNRAKQMCAGARCVPSASPRPSTTTSSGASGAG